MSVFLPAVDFADIKPVKNLVISLSFCGSYNSFLDKLKSEFHILSLDEFKDGEHLVHGYNRSVKSLDLTLP